MGVCSDEEASRWKDLAGTFGVFVPLEERLKDAGGHRTETDPPFFPFNVEQGGTCGAEYHVAQGA